jgi:enterochelin esterase-like enzyme
MNRKTAPSRDHIKRAPRRIVVFVTLWIFKKFKSLSCADAETMRPLAFVSSQVMAFCPIGAILGRESREFGSPALLLYSGDMERRSRSTERPARFIAMSVMAVVASWASPSVSRAGEIQRNAFHSRVLGRDYAYTIYLPDGYDASDICYPALYLLHTASGSEYSWIRQAQIDALADRLIDEGRVRPFVIVMPGHNRSWWIDSDREQAATALFQDVIPHVERHYRVIPERCARYICGVSAGGFGTVNAVFGRPDLFVAGAAVSPAIYDPEPPRASAARRDPPFQDESGVFDVKVWKRLNYPRRLADYRKKKQVVTLFIYSGDKDCFGIARHADALFKRLKKHQPEDVFLSIVEGGHNWKFWRGLLPDVLVDLLRPSCAPSASSPVPGIPAMTVIGKNR